MTKLVVPILVHDLNGALADAESARAAGADLVELRIDTFTDDPGAVTELVSRCPLPCLVTCRHADEGGGFDGDDSDRITALEHAGLAVPPPAYIDLELASYRKSANLRQKVHLVVRHDSQPPSRPVETRLILSTHDFETRPADLTRRVSEMAQHDACRVIKAAWHARSLRDNLEAFELIATSPKPTVALAMGEFGLMSRVLAKKFNALLTFARLDDGAGTAPGQPSIRDMKSLYRWDRLGPTTKVFGVIGHPVGHSLSPALHNAAFDATGYDGVYLPMPVAPGYEPFKATVLAMLDDPRLDLAGLSVTLPHKENLLRLVEEQGGEIEPLTARIGAANTLVIRKDRSLYACNTDYAAARDAVCDSLKITAEKLAGVEVAVLGAGGVSRALVAAFTDAGASVTVYNRTVERAEELAQAFGAESAPLDRITQSKAQVYINGTSLGMHPKTEGCPIPEIESFAGFGPGAVVFDTIYNPQQTRLLSAAQKAGCATVTGLDMFLRQGAAQFTHWTQLDAPLQAMREVLER